MCVIVRPSSASWGGLSAGRWGDAMIKPLFLMNSRWKARITQRVNRDFEKIKPDRVITTKLGAFLRASDYWRSDKLEEVYEKHHGKFALMIPQWMQEFWKRLRGTLTNLLVYVHDAGPGRPLFWTEYKLKVLRHMFWDRRDPKSIVMRIFSKWGHRVRVRGKNNCFTRRWWKRKGIPPPWRPGEDPQGYDHPLGIRV